MEEVRCMTIGELIGLLENIKNDPSFDENIPVIVNDSSMWGKTIISEVHGIRLSTEDIVTASSNPDTDPIKLVGKCIEIIVD